MAERGGGQGKEKIEWVKQPVPKFIQQFKERTNQKESPTLDSKHKTDRNAEADDEERDDETPLVCISSSNVSQEEAESFIKESYGDKADVRIEDPKKRSHENAGVKDEKDGEQLTFKKPKKEEENVEKTKKKKSKMKKVKDTKLLSFGDQDEEED